MSLALATNTYTWAQLASFLGVKSPEDKAEEVWGNVIGGDYSWCKSEAVSQLGDDATEEQIEAKAAELEQESIDRECDECNTRYQDALRTVAENLFQEHLLSLTLVEGKWKDDIADGVWEEEHFVVEPMKGKTLGWYRSASKIIDTINGVGIFEFRTVRELVESGPYPTIEQAVLHHTHWISSYPEVYEGTKARSLVDARMR